MPVHRGLKTFRHLWIYVLGLLIAASVILVFFTLAPSTESPPFP